jgi:hypothetical protein
LIGSDVLVDVIVDVSIALTTRMNQLSSTFFIAVVIIGRLEGCCNSIPLITMAFSSTTSSSNIHHATYPLPQPLALLLEAVAASNAAAHKESKQTALFQILSNALQAIDRLYFSESSSIRTSDWFVHRTCLRIRVSHGSSITITDLGTGMTRADLINALGIGRLSRQAAQYVVKHGTAAANKQQDDVDENIDENIDGDPVQDSESEDVVGVDAKEEDGETVDTDDDQNDDDDETSDNDADDDDSLLPCMEADIGGFYAALCALGVGVTIGTKVSFSRCCCRACACADLVENLYSLHTS